MQEAIDAFEAKDRNDFTFGDRSTAFLTAHDTVGDPSPTHVAAAPKLTNETYTVLFLAADAIDPARRLELEEERRASFDSLGDGGRINAVIGPSTKLALVIDSLAKAPAIVHIGGRGHHRHELVFVGDDGTSRHLPPERVARIFRKLDKPPTLVLFGTPGSMPLAAAAVRYVPYAIGFQERVNGTRLLRFSTEFYWHIASHFELDIPRAFALAKRFVGDQGFLFEHSVTP